MATMNYATSLVGPNTGFQNAQYIGQLLANPNSQGLFNQMQYGSPAYNGQGGGGYSGGGQGGVSPYDVPGQYQAAYNEAKLKNEQRYNDILQGRIARENNLIGMQSGQMNDVLDGYEQRYQRGMDNLEGLGDQQIEDTKQRAKNAASKNYQHLVGVGLTSSTLTPTMRNADVRAEGAELRRDYEGLRREKLGYDAQLSGDALGAQERQYALQRSTYGDATEGTLGFMERRSDTYPDFNQLAGLGQAYGAGGGSGWMNGVPQGVNLAEFGYQLPGMQNGQLNFGGGMGMGNAGFANFVQPWVMMEGPGRNLNAGAQPAPGSPLPAFGGVDPAAVASTYGGGEMPVHPSLVQQYGEPAALTMQQVVAILGRYPESYEEVAQVVSLLETQNAPPPSVYA